MTACARCSGRSGRKTYRPRAPAGRAPSVQPPASGIRENRPSCVRANPGSTRQRVSPADTAAGRRARNAHSPRLVRAAVGRQVPLELPFAPVAHQLGQRDFHRAHALALAAESGGVGQMPRLVDADQPGGQHRPHRPRIHPAIGVAADRAVDRAMVHAGGAANAAQHLLELGAQHCRSAVVDQDDVVFLRPVQVARRAARRWRTSCRRRNPARSRTAPAPAAATSRPPAWGRISRCWRARCEREAGSGSGRHCPRW